MVLKIFKIEFTKKSAKLNSESCKKFGIEILKNFGGLSLLSNLTVTSRNENTIEINCEEDVSSVVSGAMALCGSYQETNIKITEEKSSLSYILT